MAIKLYTGCNRNVIESIMKAMQVAKFKSDINEVLKIYSLNEPLGKISLIRAQLLTIKKGFT